MRNKAKISSGVVKTVAAGLLTGGIGAVAVVGGAAAAYVAKRLYRRAQSSVATANIAYAQQTVGGMTKTVSSKSTGAKIQEVNYLHALVLTEVATLCSNKSMADIMTAFIELDEDGKALQKLMPMPTKKTLTFCDQAWSLLEHVERIKLREADLADALELFQEFIEYIVLVTSSFEDDGSTLNHFEWRRRQAVDLIISKAPGNSMDQRKAAALSILNAEANSSDVFHTGFFSKNKNFEPWICAHNPEFVGTGQGVMPQISDGQSSLNKAAKDTLIAKTGMSAGTTGVSTGLHVLNNLSNQQDLLNNITTASKGLAESSLSSIGASATSGGIGILSDVIFLSLANYIDKELLEKYRTAFSKKIEDDENARRNGLQQKQLIELFSEVDGDAVSALRTSAKKILQKTAEKVEHLVVADQELNALLTGSSSASTLANRLMRRQKLQSQVEGLKPLLFMFHECTTARAIGIINSSKALEKHIKESIVGWVDKHPAEPCNHDNAVCYMDSALGLASELTGKIILNLPQGTTLESLRKQVAGRPVHPGPKGEGGLRKEIDKYA
jgi:hypothetical protein